MEENNDNSDSLSFTPLGSGQEVGRSCHLLEYKGKRVMLDCGVHPGLHGVDALPFVDFVEIENIDLLLITHFHLDHCGALPWLLQKTAFRGKCFMTHATKAIYRMLLGDYVRISKYGGADRNQLYTEDDLEKSMAKIETIDFREQKEVNGIRFWPYVAGHVLGACQFMIEIAGVRVLYTGDFSCLEDRHLCAAEIPPITPQVLITESTYGTQTHEERSVREKRFTQMVHDIVTRGGRCLIPAFAIGPAQELMLILDEYWESHQELHDIPVYYASSLAKKCMSVYQTFVNGMNSRIQKQIAVKNPVSDMYADSVTAAILHAQANPVPEKYLPASSSFPPFNTALEGMVKHICGDDVSLVMSDRGLLAQFEEDGRRLPVEGNPDGPVTMGGDDPMDDPTTSHILQGLTEKMRQIVTTNNETDLIDDMEY